MKARNDRFCKTGVFLFMFGYRVARVLSRRPYTCACSPTMSNYVVLVSNEVDRDEGVSVRGFQE